MSPDSLSATELRDDFRPDAHAGPDADLEDAAVLLAMLAVTPRASEWGAAGPPAPPGYQILGELGRGGMGVVYEALDLALGRHVAVKVMRPDRAANPLALRRFLREARAAATVRNEHVVVIHGVGEAAGLPYLVMERLLGETLENRLRRRDLSLAETLRIGQEVAAGLAAAHAHGLIHRDVKPANIWLDAADGRVKILDFGLVRRDGDDVGLTQAGDVLGTLAYMAPEQARGVGIDARSDLFSLGCVLHQMFTGVLPLAGDDVADALRAGGRPFAASDAPPAHELLQLVTRLLSKKPEDRPNSAEEVRQVLERLATASGRRQGERASSDAPPADTAAPPRGLSHLPSPPRARCRPAALLVVGAAVALVFGVVGWWHLHVPASAFPAAEGPGPVAAPSVPLAVVPAKHEWMKDAVIPKAEIFPGQPKELIAVLGKHVRMQPGTAHEVNGVAFDPNGRWVASSSLDAENAVCLWDATTGERQQLLGPIAVRAHSVAFSADGGKLAAGYADGMVRLWDLTKPESEAQEIVAGAAAPVLWAAFSADGKMLAAAGPGCGVRMWRLNGDKAAPVVAGQHKAVGACALAISPGGATLASLGLDETLYLWRLSTDRLAPLAGFRSGPPARGKICFAPDGQTLYALSDSGVVRRWHPDHGEWTELDPFRGAGNSDEDWGGLLYGLGVSADGRRLATASSTGHIVLWDAASGTKLLEWQMPITKGGPGDMTVNDVAFPPDGGNYLATANNNGTVYILRLPE